MDEKKLPKVSIITVCKNASPTIEETLKSVSQQTYPAIECIVVDGKSSDHSLEIVKKYKRIISKIISEPDHGIYDAMNKGIHHSKGDWLLFLGADDQLSPKVSEVFSKLHEYHDADVVYGDVQYSNGKVFHSR